MSKTNVRENYALWASINRSKMNGFHKPFILTFYPSAKDLNVVSATMNFKSGGTGYKIFKAMNGIGWLEVSNLERLKNHTDTTIVSLLGMDNVYEIPKDEFVDFCLQQMIGRPVKSGQLKQQVKFSKLLKKEYQKF